MSKGSRAVRWAAAIVLLAGTCGSCRGGVTDPTGPEDPIDPLARDVASLRLESDVTILSVGRTVTLRVEARDADGEVLPGVEAALSVTPDGVLDVDGTRVTAAAPGNASVVARVGEVESPALGITVTEGEEPLEASVRITPGRLALAVGQAARFDVTVRDGFGQRLSEPEVELHAEDGAVLRQEDDGRLVAAAAGRTTVIAEHDGVRSPPADVVVGEGPYLAIDWIAPTGGVVAASTVDAAVRVQELTFGSPSEFGLPKTPSQAELLVDGAVVGTLTGSFGEARGRVALSGVSPGAHTMRVRVTADGQTGESAAIGLTVRAPATTFEALGDGEGGDQGDVLFHGGAVYRVANDCERECRTHVHRWTGDAWQGQRFKQREWDADGDWQAPTGYHEDVRDVDQVSLPRFQGWGWPPRSARDPRLAVIDGALGLVWSNEEARTSFNEESMPERFWFDCYGARWDGGGGRDGQGAFDLLSADDPEYLQSLPHPDAIGERDAYQFPAGADRVRTRDCEDPQPLDLGGTAMAFLSAPIPGDTWSLELRRWSGGAWSDVVAAHPLTGAVLPQMTSAVVHGGRAVVALGAESGPVGVLRLEDGAWVSIEDGTRDLRALATRDDELYAAGVRRGDLRVYRATEAGWEAMGIPLDVDPWAEVREVTLLAADGVLAVAWAEGPAAGNRVLHVARWAGGTWQRVGEGPVEAHPDRPAASPRLARGDDGRLYLSYVEHTGGEDDQPRFVVRVLRSEPL